MYSTESTGEVDEEEVMVVVLSEVTESAVEGVGEEVEVGVLATVLVVDKEEVGLAVVWSEQG